MTSTSVLGKNLQNGKYILQQELGQGGFGCTYKAINRVLNQTVVIKTLKSDLNQKSHQSDFRIELLHEAQRLIKCHHPNIVRFYEFFREDEVPYIVMDYIPGKTLDKVVFPDNPFPEAMAVDYIRQVGEALKVVHRNGLLHRDVKPQNLILREDNQQIILIDFGIAREFSRGAVQTHTNLVSDGYAPIEQYLPKAQRTPATDIYGLAATLYTLVTAQIPIAATLRNRIPLDNPQKIRPELSNELSQAIMKGMALELEERPKSIDEWLGLLPQTDGDINSSLSTTVSLVQTKNKLLQNNLVSKIKKSSQNKQIWAKLILFAGLIGILDYAWLRFQAFSENEQIQVNTIEEFNKLTSEINNSSDSATVTDDLVSPETLQQQNQSAITLTPNSQPTTPETKNSSDSATLSDFVPSPNEEAKETPATSNSQPLTLESNNSSGVNRVPAIFGSPDELEKQTKSNNKSQATTSASKDSRRPAIFTSPDELEQKIDQTQPNLSQSITSNSVEQDDDDDDDKKKRRRKRRGKYDDDDDYDDD